MIWVSMPSSTEEMHLLVISSKSGDTTPVPIPKGKYTLQPESKGKGMIPFHFIPPEWGNRNPKERVMQMHLSVKSLQSAKT